MEQTSIRLKKGHQTSIRLKKGHQTTKKTFGKHTCFNMGRDSSVSVVTDYGLDGPGIESRWGLDIPYLSRPALGPTQPPIQWLMCLMPGGKAAGLWR
jgi:hypothetical protein